MTDQELLIAAASAVNGGSWHPLTHDTPGGKAWNPLEDDGDALRLAVKLQLEIRPGTWNVTAAGDGIWEEVSRGDYSAEEATRRAIVHAAAALASK